MQSSEKSRYRDSESGFVLLAVIFLTLLLLLSLAIAAPKMARAIQRDRDLETIHRGEQYKRAIKLYYAKFGSYPTSVDQLVETNEIRFLRKRYKDPLTGKDDWKPVLFGHAHVRPLGFFGQPLSGVGMAAIGAGGMSGSMYAAAPASTTDSSGVPTYNGGDPSSADTDAGAADQSAGAPSSSGSSFGSSGSSFGSSGSSFGSSGSSFGSSGSSFGSSGSSFGSSGSGFGSNASGLGSSSGGLGSTSSGFGSSSSSGFGSSSSSAGGGTSATSFGGGGPIVGFTLPVNKPSLVDYKHQTRYNKWEFNYDPIEDQMLAAGGLTGGAPPSATPGSTTNPMMPGTSSSTGSTPGLGTQPATTSPTTSSPSDSWTGSSSSDSGSSSSSDFPQ